ncbi:hypothetical protein [Streptomyces acidicola]|uniref:hypothetical protein n=1 Tax=Streptomyces acidicola TaxID=2596892 RepID=UPI0034412FA2
MLRDRRCVVWLPTMPLLTKVTREWPHRQSIALTLLLLGTLIRSVGKIIGGPAVMAHPGFAGPPRLKAHYIGGLRFIRNLDTVVGPVGGGWLFVQLGHQVCPVFAAGFPVGTSLVLAVPGRARAAE